MKETAIFCSIKDLIDSDIFKHLIENNKFREKVQCNFEQEFVLGHSSIGLLNLEQNIKELVRLYVQHYKQFTSEASKLVEKDIQKMSVVEQKEIREITRSRICTYEFFNEISNANLF